MKALFTAQLAILFFVLVRSADLATSRHNNEPGSTNTGPRSIVRTVIYSLVALLALIVVILALIV